MFFALTSLLDSIIIIPLNSEIRIIKRLMRDYPLKQKVIFVFAQYFLPGVIGSMISYAIAFFYKEQIMKIIIFTIQHTGGAGGKYLLENIEPLYMLASKAVVPSMPMTTITYLAGARQCNIFQYLAIIITIKLLRSMCIIVFAHSKTMHKTYKILELFNHIVYVIAISSMIQLITLLQYNNINVILR